MQPSKNLPCDVKDGLRIFKRDKSGDTIYSQDLSSFLQIDPKHLETDIEGATLIKNRIYWITIILKRTHAPYPSKT